MDALADFLRLCIGKNEGGRRSLRYGKLVMNLAVHYFPCAFDVSETRIEVTTGKGHLPCCVGSGSEDEVAEAGMGFVTLNAERAADEPLAYRPERMM